LPPRQEPQALPEQRLREPVVQQVLQPARARALPQERSAQQVLAEQARCQ